MANKIWFITGISSGLGKALAESAIDNGDFVIGTFRDALQADIFNAQHPDKALGMVLDITDHKLIEDSFQFIKERFGRIDILVNNAGFGIAGAIEETSIDEVRTVFDANFFGTLKITQASLPLFRAQRNGHIIQISSHGGFKAFAGFGIYNASKFAVEGFSEALAQEIAPLGIKLTIVEPGPFRTNFAGEKFRLAGQTIDEYKATAGLFRDKIKYADGKQEGDPVKAAQVIVDITELDTPPLRLPLGKTAMMTLANKLNSVSKDMNEFKYLAESVVFD